MRRRRYIQVISQRRVSSGNSGKLFISLSVKPNNPGRTSKLFQSCLLATDGRIVIIYTGGLGRPYHNVCQGLPGFGGMGVRNTKPSPSGAILSPNRCRIPTLSSVGRFHRDSFIFGKTLHYWTDDSGSQIYMDGGRTDRG